MATGFISSLHDDDDDCDDDDNDDNDDDDDDDDDDKDVFVDHILWHRWPPLSLLHLD